jgi:hypothetical protein
MQGQKDAVRYLQNSIGLAAQYGTWCVLYLTRVSFEDT